MCRFFVDMGYLRVVDENPLPDVGRMCPGLGVDRMWIVLEFDKVWAGLEVDRIRIGLELDRAWAGLEVDGETGMD